MSLAPTGPMGLGDILDETIRLYRQQVLVYVGIMALTFVPVTIIATFAGVGVGISIFALPDADLSIEMVVGLFVLILVLGGLYFLAFLVSQAWATVVASAGFLARPKQLLPAFGDASRHLIRLLAVTILVAVLLLGLVFLDVVLIVLPFVVDPLFGVVALALRLLAGMVAAGVYLASAGSRTPVLRGVAAVGVPFGAAVYCGVRWALFVQALLLENLGPRAALHRSWRLTSDYFWRTLGFLMLLAVLVAVLQYIPGLLLGVPLGVLEALTQPGALDSGLPLTSLAANLGSAIGWIIFGAIQWLAATVYYYDLRIRKEAFDLELRAGRLVAALSEGGAGADS